MFRIKTSTFIRDSFWSVFGNGLGNFLLLIGGILIARFLGKELYGEYGMVKTTMFYIGGFASFGLEYTATKFVAQMKSQSISDVNGYVKASLYITTFFSLSLWIILFLFSNELAHYLNAPTLSSPFKYLGAILFFRALCSSSKGILGGFKDFKALGINSILSGLLFIILGPALTFYWGIIGSFIALLSTQVVNSILNLYVIFKHHLNLKLSANNNLTELLLFSFPVAMQELIFSITNWGAMLVLTKYANLGEVGIYSAASQWYAVTLFIPNMLANVVLSYLASSANDSNKYEVVLNKMLLINLLCSLIPFIIIFVSSSIITSFYGNDFTGLKVVLNVLVLGTVFACLANVFQADYIANNRNWLLFLFRSIRDGLILLLLYFTLSFDNSRAALKFAIINTLVYFVYFTTMYAGNKIRYSKS